VAIETIYRELDRAKALSCRPSDRAEEEEHFGEVDADWTLVDDEGGVQDMELPLEAMAGMHEQVMDGSETGPATLALGAVLSQQRRAE
jgi:sterol 3beta-glucosyltransferase